MPEKGNWVMSTELELAVLGVVWREGRCTAYAIRQHFRVSPTPRWSGSAGAIYPLVRRLETRGLLKSAPNARGRRSQRDYRVTRAGRAELKRWLRAPIGADGASLIHDPLRTRVLFLGVLTPGEARSFVTSALEELRTAVEWARDDCRQNPVGKNPCAHFAARNALLVARARLAWMREIEAGLSALWPNPVAGSSAERSYARGKDGKNGSA